MAENNFAELFAAKVVDNDGDKIGSIGQVYLDDNTGQASWITVRTGLFGLKETFIPLHGAVLADGVLTVPYQSQTVKEAPRMDPDKHLDADEEYQLYKYYGLRTEPLDAQTTAAGRGVNDPAPVEEPAVEQVEPVEQVEVVEVVEPAEQARPVEDISFLADDEPETEVSANLEAAAAAAAAAVAVEQAEDAAPAEDAAEEAEPQLVDSGMVLAIDESDAPSATMTDPEDEPAEPAERAADQADHAEVEHVVDPNLDALGDPLGEKRLSATDLYDRPTL